jgi:dihydroorotase
MSNHPYTLCLKNGHVMINDKLVYTNVYIQDEKISLVSDKNYDVEQTIDCKNLTILPGVIDSQVHFREPGLEGKETLASGMLAAVSGGVTSIFEMPNTNPLTITPETIEDKLNRASKEAWSDYAFYLGGTMRTSKNLPEWEKLKGVCGIKIFMGASTGDLMTATDEEVESVVSNGGRVIAVHAEDQMIMMNNFESILGSSKDV